MHCLQSSADVKELTPELYYLPEELTNVNEYIRETRLKLQRKMEDLEDQNYQVRKN